MDLAEYIAFGNHRRLPLAEGERFVRAHYALVDLHGIDYFLPLAHSAKECDAPSRAASGATDLSDCWASRLCQGGADDAQAMSHAFRGGRLDAAHFQRCQTLARGFLAVALARAEGTACSVQEAIARVVHEASQGAPVPEADAEPAVASLLQLVAVMGASAVGRRGPSAPERSFHDAAQLEPKAKGKKGKPTPGKKSHEVDALAAFLQRAVPAPQPAPAPTGAEDAVFVDIGAGQGDLCAALATAGRTTIAVERDAVQVHGSAVKRAKTLQAQELSGGSMHVCHLDMGPNTTGDHLVAAVGKTLAAASPGQSQPEAKRGIVMCSLHACGQLSEHMLRCFARWGPRAAPRCDIVVNVGCCYNLLALDGARVVHPAPADAPATVVAAEQPAVAVTDEYVVFPRSAVEPAAGQELWLTRNGLAAACQAPARWTWAEATSRHSRDGNQRPIFWGLVCRAAVERLLFDTGRSTRAVRVRGDCQCPPTAAPAAEWAAAFTTYAAEACKPFTEGPGALALDALRLTAESVAAAVLTDTAPPQRKRDRAASRSGGVPTTAADMYCVLWGLRCLLGTLLETLLLADRAAIVATAGTRVGLVSLFDPAVSPRHIAVVAVRDASTETTGPVR